MGQKLDTCPKFVLYLSMHPIYSTIVSIFAHELDKNGTIVRHRSYICPPSVTHPIYFTIISIFAHKLEKNGTIVGRWSYICPLSVHTPYSFYNYLYFCT